MSEIFRERVVESPVSPEIAPQAPLPLKSDELKGYESKASTPLDKEQLNLDIWEGEHKMKFVTDYFGVKEYEGEFNLKMQTSLIDKYIKGELDNRKYEKNTDNWKNILSEIETEIRSERLDVFSRIKKIVGYINVLNKLNKAKALKEQYLTLQN